MTDVVVSLIGVGHTTRLRSRTLTLLHDVSFEARAGELVALAGRSGSGKSTVCTLVAGLDEPTSGRVLVDGRPAHTVRDWATVAYLPQHLAVEGALTVEENVAAATLDRSPDERTELLDRLGLAAVSTRTASEVSVGERQRVAVARAAAAGSRVIVLDEPTSAQDEANVRRVIEAIRSSSAEGSCVLLATHDPRVLAVCDRVIALADGTVVTP